MTKIALTALFFLTMASLALAASAMPTPETISATQVVRVAALV